MEPKTEVRDTNPRLVRATNGFDSWTVSIPNRLADHIEVDPVTNQTYLLTQEVVDYVAHWVDIGGEG